MGRRTAMRVSMFADIERMDAHAWAAHLAPDAVMRLGNAEPVCGRDRCREAMSAFYDRVDAVQHDLIEQWEHGEATIVEASVTYTRTDGAEVTLPVVTIYRTDAENLISDYRVYTDFGPVFSPEL